MRSYEDTAHPGRRSYSSTPELNVNRVVPAGQLVPDAPMATLRLTRDTFRGEWNYTIAPRIADSG
jgi:hypothetical protein